MNARLIRNAAALLTFVFACALPAGAAMTDAPFPIAKLNGPPLTIVQVRRWIARYFSAFEPGTAVYDRNSALLPKAIRERGVRFKLPLHDPGGPGAPIWNKDVQTNLGDIVTAIMRNFRPRGPHETVQWFVGRWPMQMPGGTNITQWQGSIYVTTVGGVPMDTLAINANHTYTFLSDGHPIKGTWHEDPLHFAILLSPFSMKPFGKHVWTVYQNDPANCDESLGYPVSPWMCHAKDIEHDNHRDGVVLKPVDSGVPTFTGDMQRPL